MSSRNSSLTGAGEKPQLPTTSVVTPWRILDSARRLAKSRQSEWECMSMKPGATVSPAASTISPAGSRERSPTAVMLSPVTPTSARTAGTPVPSRTCPPEILRSSTRHLFEAYDPLAPGRRGQQPRLAPRRAAQLDGEWQPVGREPGGQRDRGHAGETPRRAVVRIARGLEPLRRGAGRRRRDERVVAGRDRPHLG